MSSSPSYPFRVVSHEIPCQHIREYPRATITSQEEVLHLAVKQYIPLDNPHPQPGDVTIIGAHANGFPKELYEALWEDVLTTSKKQGFRIRSIWIADVAHQGQSGILNEELVGNDPAWFDHVRDLLHMINLKREEMPRPIVGIGHSWGGAQLVNIALFHQRLFTTLVLMDPVIQEQTSKMGNYSPAKLSTFRRDTWPSRDAAAELFSKSSFYKGWDPRVLQSWIDYGLRDMPTYIYPEESSPPKVTLTTTKHQEVFTFLRPNYEGIGSDGKVNRRTHPDVNPTKPHTSPFYRAEPPKTLDRIPELRPSVLYIFGGTSDMSQPEAIAKKMRLTGTGPGGSGGAPEGRVKEVTLKDIGHLVAMDAPQLCADAACEWLGSELTRWKEEEEEFNQMWHSKTRRERQTVDQDWIKHMGGDPREAKEKNKKTAKL